jgi:UDP-glucose 4-epimerase
MNLLVTGGAGYIGSVVTARLLETGHAVTVLDDLSQGHANAVPPGATLLAGRIHDAASVLSGARVDAVIHLAASSIVSEPIAPPELYEENNVEGTRRLCDAMRAAGVCLLVFSSSAAVYGEPEAGRIDESVEEAPVNPYGSSKLAVDRDLARRAAAGGLGSISLHYFNVAGADGPYGERHHPETHLIPLALEAVLLIRPALVVYGDDYPTPDGTCIRDYVHVLDIADAHLLALEALEPGRHEVLNLGNGDGFSVRDVVDTVCAVTGRSLPVTIGLRRTGDPAMLVADPGRARSRLGWSPSRPKLGQIVEDEWQFAAGARR